MLILGIILVASIAANVLLSRDNKEKVMKEYCRLECKQNVSKKHKFCC